MALTLCRGNPLLFAFRWIELAVLLYSCRYSIMPAECSLKVDCNGGGNYEAYVSRGAQISR